MLALILAVCTVQPIAAFAAINPKDSQFQRYLKEIEMTEGEFMAYFEELHDSFDDFKTLGELKEYLGEPLNEENLAALLKDYELTRPELEQLLADNGMALEDFIFIEDLDIEVDWIINGDEYGDFESSDEELRQALDMFGITDEEAGRLSAHLEQVVEDPDGFSERLLSLAGRMMALEEFESSSELTQAQANEIVSIWNELLSLFQVDAKYFLVKDGAKQPISLMELIQMDDIDGADLLIEIYSTSGEFLADLLITKDMFGSDMINETVGKVSKTESISGKKSAKPARTVNGGKLPNTAAHYIPQAATGFAILLLGFFLLRKARLKDI